MEVALTNLLPDGDDGWLVNTRTVTIDSPLVRTVKPGVVHRLAAGDEVRVEVLVAPKKGVKAGSEGKATIELRDLAGNLLEVSKGWTAKVPTTKWGSDVSSLEQHEAPNWVRVKTCTYVNATDDVDSGTTPSLASCALHYGVYLRFSLIQYCSIHWGPFSVPAYAPPGVYAEWYQCAISIWLPASHSRLGRWHIHNPPDSSNPFWNHHLETYGKVRCPVLYGNSSLTELQDVIYEDFIPQFTASKFNASAWVELFEDAGAKVRNYFCALRRD